MDALRAVWACVDGVLDIILSIVVYWPPHLKSVVVNVLLWGDIVCGGNPVSCNAKQRTLMRGERQGDREIVLTEYRIPRILVHHCPQVTSSHLLLFFPRPRLVRLGRR